MAFKRRQPRNNFKHLFTRVKQRATLKKAGEASTFVSQHSHRGIYLLPNLFTTAALFCGFYAIVMGMNGAFEKASIAIFIAMVFDSLDGRVARLIHAQSEFGAQYDSLSDMVSFAAAPALVAYEWGLRGLGQWGWLAAFIYCACTALRLARFNTNINKVDACYFQGLPCPAAAALVAGFIWSMTDLDITGTSVRWMMWILTIVAGLTMVSNIPFYSFKNINLKKSVPFAVPFVLVLAYVLIVIDPPKVLFTIFMLYFLSGYVLLIWRWKKGERVSILQTELEPNEDSVT